MDEEYDVILLGTGLVECVLSGLLSVSGKKVLHIDRNDYYGGELASLNIEQLFKKFNKGNPPAKFGNSRDWNVDLCLKLIMAESNLVGMLVFTNVTRYMEFCQIQESYVKRAKNIYRVPVTEKDVLTSSLLGLFDKKRLRSFVLALNKCDISAGEVPSDFTPTTPMREVLKKYNINNDLSEMIGHVIALHQTDDYLDQPCLDTFKKIQTYTMSLQKCTSSPYVYPLYGLGEIPQSFARLSSVYGGTYMLNTAVDKVVTDDSGKFVGIQSGENLIKAGMVIGDPSYFTDRVKEVGKIVRCICILSHPIKCAENKNSCQIIIPAGQTGRKSDVYIGMVSKTNEVCPQGFYIATVTANVESVNPEDDVKPGLELLGQVEEKFLMVSSVYQPTDYGRDSKIFVSNSYDATTHFDTADSNIIDLWERITGEKMDNEKFKNKIYTQEN